MKLIAITAMTALLLFALITCASADEKIYTSPVFKLPPERIRQAEELMEDQPEDAEPDESQWIIVTLLRESYLFSVQESNGKPCRRNTAVPAVSIGISRSGRRKDCS